MGFSLLCWNIEKFDEDKPGRAAREQVVADAIAVHDPDVFGILEFLAKDSARRIVSKFFTAYDFAFTDSKMGIEILVGWRRGKFAQALYTQRRELQAGNENLRPGGLLSVRQKNATAFDNVLFLHTDSGTLPEEFDRRKAMFGKIWSLKSALAALPDQGGNARLIALGDLNTMGRKLTPGKPTIPAAEEIAALTTAANQAGMQMLTKSAPKTWSNPSGSKTSNLDHVLASSDLTFKPQTVAGQTSQVLVDGWVNKTGNARRAFIENVSDHSMLFVEVT